jgi:hypothetical protein
MAKRKRRNTLTAEQWYPSFLAALGQIGNVTLACTSASVTRSTVYRHRRDNPAFAQEWEYALEDAGDRLEAEARRRAVMGVEKKRLILYKGEPVIDWAVPGKWVDDQGKEWVEGVSRGRKRWTGAYLYETEITYSDRLLEVLLKGAKPEKYADRMRMRVDQVALQREAERLAKELDIPVEVLYEEVKRLQAGSVL